MPASVAVTQTAPEIKVNGQAMPNEWYRAVTAMRIEREVNLVGRAVLRFADSGYQLSASNRFALGTKVEVLVRDASPAIFSGIVTGAALEQVPHQVPELVVTIDDLACRLGVDTRVVAHANKSFKDIVGEMAGRAGLRPALEFGPTGEAVNEYLLQHGTDLEFLTTLTERAGCVWWVDDGRLRVTAAGVSTRSVALDFERDLIDFSVRASALRPVAVQVGGFDIAAQQDISETAKIAANTASSTFVDGYTGSNAGRLGVSGNDLVFDVNPNVVAEAKALASSLASAWQSGAVGARGTMYANHQIVPTAALRITKAGPSSGTYTVSRVEHIYRASGFETRFVAGPVRPAGLVDTLGGARPDAGFTMPHLITAVVEDVRDPKKWGRVRVEYRGAGGKLVSNWARVVSLGGGKERGSYFLPEVKDEVLVGFERGDSRHPVVFGGLFSKTATIAGDDKATGPSGDVQYRRITSRLGHIIEFSDGTAPTEQHILMQLGSPKHKVRLGADEMTIELEQGKPFTLKAGSAKIAIDATGNITIEGASITMKAAQTNIEMTASVDLKAKANVGVNVEGAMVDVKAQANGSFQASAMMAVKGNPVMIN